MPLIFQYGSNCDGERLNSPERLADDAKNPRPVQTAENFELAFNKWSTCGNCAAADLLKPRKGGRRIWGVLYEVSPAGFNKLKGIEGPSYRPQNIVVVDATGATKTAKTFRVRRKKRQAGRYTTEAYVSHIVRGLRTHQIPEEYIQYVIDGAIRTNAAAEDRPNAERQTALLESLRRPNPSR